MGNFDGAEVCELVDERTLSTLQKTERPTALHQHEIQPPIHCHKASSRSHQPQIISLIIQQRNIRQC